MVTLTAEQIGSSIADAGKAVFYGIYFDSGQSVIKPESAPTLAEMAKWLQGNPQARVNIVGHTDMQGDVGQNRTLSRARAEAVVNALVTEHGLSIERLAAEGAGPFAPVSNNTTEQGRAQNRRVEMVLRQDPCACGSMGATVLIRDRGIDRGIGWWSRTVRARD